MAQNLEAVVGIDVDTDDMINDLKKLFNDAADILGDAMKSGIKNVPNNNNSEQQQENNSIFKGMFSNLKGLLKMAGKIFAGLSIGMAIMAVFQPVFKLISSFVKIIAEFLRPITDVVTILLSPILTLLKPILIVFKSLMAPFKQAAMAGIAASNKLISEGIGLKMGENATEEDKTMGGTLISEGMKGLLSSASLMLSGFIEILFTPLFNMFPRLETGFNNWQSSAIAGILKVTEKANLLQNIDLTKINNETLTKSFSLINEYVDELKEKVDGFKIEDFDTYIDTVGENLKTVFNPLTEYISSDGDGYKALNDYTEAVKTLGLDSDTAGSLAATAATNFGKLAEALSNTNEQTSDMIKQGETNTLKNKMSDLESQKTGGLVKLFEQLKAFWTTDTMDMSMKDGIKLSVEAWKQAGKDIESENKKISNEQKDVFDQIVNLNKSISGGLKDTVSDLETKIKNVKSEIDRINPVKIKINVDTNGRITTVRP